MTQQLIKQSFLLSSQNTLTAAQVLPVENPVSRGISNLLRIDTLEMTVTGSIKDTGAGAGIDIHFKDDAEVLGFYNALLSNIRFYSSTVNDCIRNLSLGEIVKMVQFVNADFPDSTLPVPGRSMPFTNPATDEGSFQCIVRIPFALAAPSIRASFAPRVGQFTDGGLALTTGSLTFSTTDIAGANVDWEIQNSTRMEWRVRGPVLPMEAKISPLLYESYQNTGIAEFPGSSYLCLFQNTDTPIGAYGTSGGASAGWQVDVDGTPVILPSNYNPLNALSSLIQDSSDPAAFDVDSAFEDNEVSSGDARGIYSRVGVPIYNMDNQDSTFNILVAEKRLVVQPGANYSVGTVNYLACRIRPLDQVGSAPQCGSGISGPGVKLMLVVKE